MRAAVLAATQDERLAMQQGVDDDAPLMSLESKDVTIAADLGSDPYLEVPRIVYEPDDEETEALAEAAGMELDYETDAEMPPPLSVPS